LKRFFPKLDEEYFSYVWVFILKVASEVVPLSEIKDWLIKITQKVK